MLDASQFIAIKTKYPKWLPYTHNGRQIAKLEMISSEIIIKIVIKS
jgi:hypothetical protein